MAQAALLAISCSDDVQLGPTPLDDLTPRVKDAMPASSAGRVRLCVDRLARGARRMAAKSVGPTTGPTSGIVRKTWAIAAPVHAA